MGACELAIGGTGLIRLVLPWVEWFQGMYGYLVSMSCTTQCLLINVDSDSFNEIARRLFLLIVMVAYYISSCLYITRRRVHVCTCK
jgi:hypothetical protein